MRWCSCRFQNESQEEWDCWLKVEDENRQERGLMWLEESEKAISSWCFLFADQNDYGAPKRLWEPRPDDAAQIWWIESWNVGNELKSIDYASSILTSSAIELNDRRSTFDDLFDIIKCKINIQIIANAQSHSRRAHMEIISRNLVHEICLHSLAGVFVLLLRFERCQFWISSGNVHIAQ